MQSQMQEAKYINYLNEGFNINHKEDMKRENWWDIPSEVSDFCIVRAYGKEKTISSYEDQASTRACANWYEAGKSLVRRVPLVYNFSELWCKSHRQRIEFHH